MAVTATATTTLLLPSMSPPRHQARPALPVSVPGRGRVGVRTWCVGHDKLGDFGARDPFPAEIASEFGDKVLGHGDTEHKILIPTISALSLAGLDWTPVSPLQPPMSKADATKLLNKVLGWRLLETDGGLRLQCLWKLRDFKCCFELANRIYKVTDVVGHFPNLHLEQPNQVRAELWTSSIGGLSMNDFIVAAKIDEIKTSDLVPRRRAWA